MKEELIDLDYLAYHEANFAHSEREPTSAYSFISGPTPFYYMWRKSGGMDILIFDDPKDISTVKLFRCSEERIRNGVDLEEDKADYVGDAAVQILKEYVEYFENCEGVKDEERS